MSGSPLLEVPFDENSLDALPLISMRLARNVEKTARTLAWKHQTGWRLKGVSDGYYFLVRQDGKPFVNIFGRHVRTIQVGVMSIDMSAMDCIFTTIRYDESLGILCEGLHFSERIRKYIDSTQQVPVPIYSNQCLLHHRFTVVIDRKRFDFSLKPLETLNEKLELESA